MGQAITRCFGRSNASQSLPPPCPSRLEQLPMELKLDICDLLSPASLAALSLTGKYLRTVLNHKYRIDQSLKMNLEQRIDFLGLLERDIGRKRFYLCTRCAILHRFHLGRVPRKNAYYLSNSSCPRWEDTYTASPNYYLSYHHVRLVINRHLYGTEYGLPLRELEAVYSIHTFYGLSGWRQERSARIIDDELFLHVKHSIHGYHEHRLRQIIDGGNYSICGHLWLSAEFSTFSGLPVALLPPSPSAFDTDPLAGSVARPLFTECEDSHFFCPYCLTDGTVNVKLRTSKDAGHNPKANSRDWEITIHACHQLGKGRSHLDWKWVAFIS